MNTTSEGAPVATRLRRLSRHAIFPLFLFLPLSQLIRDNYPVSHFPMYSDPGSEGCSFYFLADGQEKPLATAYYTGLTPSRIGKQMGYYQKTLITSDRARAAKAGSAPSDEAGLKREAATKVLSYARKISSQRSSNRQLKGPLKLMRVNVTLADGKLTEKHEVAGELP